MANTTLPPQPITQTVRKGGQLFQEAVTPAGSALTGANPDQAKMSGTPAQKTPVIQQSVAAPVPSTKELGAEKQRVEKQQQAIAQDLGSFSGFNKQVQGVLQKKLNTVTGATTQATAADTDTLNKAFNNNLQVGDTTVQALLQQFISNPLEQAPLVKLSDALTRQTGAYVSPSNIASWVSAKNELIGETGAKNIADHVIMHDFSDDDFKALGIDKNRAAAAIGVDPEAFKSMTFSEFQDKVDKIRQETFTEVQNLRNELAGLPADSVAYNQVRDRLAALGAAGTTTTEANVAEAVRSLNTADQISFGDQSYSVDELLKDENISKIITSYLGTPDQKQKDKIIPPQYKEFISWINSQKTALAALASEMQKTATGFATTQQELGKLRSTSSVNPGLAKQLSNLGVNVNQSMTSADFSKITELVNNDPIANLILNGVPGQDVQAVQEALKDPKAVEQLQGKSVDQILAAHAAGQALAGSKELQDITGLKPASFITNPSDITRIENANRTLEATKNLSPELKASLGSSGVLNSVAKGEIPVEILSAAAILHEGQSILNNEYIQFMIKNGAITPANMNQILPQASGMINQWKKDKETHEALQKLPDDQLIQAIFGDSNTSMSTLNKNYQDAKMLKEMGAPLQENDNTLAALDLFDTNDDGFINETDLPGIRSAASVDVGKTPVDYITGKKPAGGLLDKLSKEPSVKRRAQSGPTPGGIFDKVKAAFADGTISIDEAQDLSATGEFDKIAESWRKKYMPEGYRSFNEANKTQTPTVPSNGDTSQPAQQTTGTEGSEESLNESLSKRNPLWGAAMAAASEAAQTEESARKAGGRVAEKAKEVGGRVSEVAKEFRDFVTKPKWGK